MNNNNIYIYDTRNGVFNKSKMKTPKQGCFYSVIKGSKEYNELLVSGFIRRCYEDIPLNNAMKLPVSIVQFMSQWHGFEEIYLLDEHGVDLWKMNSAFSKRNIVGE